MEHDKGNGDRPSDELSKPHQSVDTARNTVTTLEFEYNKAVLDNNVYSHVTDADNLTGIQQEGLKASRGGDGGAGSKVEDAEDRKVFVETSKNYVHLGKDSEGVENKPSEFYTNFIKKSGGEPVTLTVALPTGVTLEEDKFDQQGGRYKTRSDIPPETIISIPIETAIRPHGVIGADLAREAFVDNLTRGMTVAGDDVTSKVEAIRKLVHNQPFAQPMYVRQEGQSPVSDPSPHHVAPAQLLPRKRDLSPRRSPPPDAKSATDQKKRRHGR